MLAEFLYRLNQRDLALPLLLPSFQQQSFSAASTAVGGMLFTVPSDSLLAVMQAEVRGAPGAGQICQWVAMTIREPNAGRFINIAWLDTRATAAGVTRNVQSTFEPIIVPAGWAIESNGQFDLGGVANTVEGRIYGFLIPRGNVSAP